MEHDAGWTRLAPPSNTEAVCDGPDLRVKWDAAQSAAAYEIFARRDGIAAEYRETTSLLALEIYLPLAYGTGNYKFALKSLPSTTAEFVMPSTLSEEKAFIVLPEHFEARMMRYGKTGAECGKLLFDDNNKIEALALAEAMAKAGYAKTDTGLDLEVVWPDISAANLAIVLLKAYG